MCPIYEYIHPETSEIFEDIRKYKDRDKPFISPDGKRCMRLEVPSSMSGWRKDREGFEMDPSFYKKMKPKFVKFKDGHREKYDPNKHN